MAILFYDLDFTFFNQSQTIQQLGLPMRRYFYDSSNMIAKWLQKNAFTKSYQDDIYRAAFLSALKNDPKTQLKILKEQILNMTMAQQEKYANNTHIEQLFNLFHHLHRYSRGREMIVDGNTSKGSTELVDPDKFPIWDLKKYSPIYKSLWDNYLADLRYDLGFQLIIRQSQVEHIAGGRGTYAILPMKHQTIGVGSLIGLVPGKIFKNFQDYKSISLQKRKQYYRQPQHIHFPSGKILQLGDLALKRKSPFGLDTEDSQNRVDATYHNPYAIGHMINHPPPGYEPNVCFSELSIKPHYFPKHLLRYLPYEDYTTDLKNITLFGIFAIKEIEDKEQLFVNYNESHIYPIDNVPEWMIDPAQFSSIYQYLRKGEYQLTESSYWRYIQSKALDKNRQLLQKYQKQKVLRPDAVEFEDKQRRYKKLKIRLEDENQFEHM